MSEKLKNVLILGCSMMNSNYWELCKEDLDCLNADLIGLDGHGNKRIVSSLIDYIAEKPDLKYVYLSFSGFDRDDFIVKRKYLDYLETDKSNDRYDRHGYFWYRSGGYGGTWAHENDMKIFEPRYKLGYRFLDRVKENTHYMLLAQSILQAKGIPYTFMFYSNQLENYNFLTGCQIKKKELTEGREYVPFSNVKENVPALDLIDFSKFWLYNDGVSKFSGIEEFAHANHQVALDNHHPTPEIIQELWQDHLRYRCLPYL